MPLIDQVDQPLAVDMGVYLRRVEVIVAEHLLKRAHVDAGRPGAGVTADSFAWVGAAGVRTGPGGLPLAREAELAGRAAERRPPFLSPVGENRR